MFVLFLIVCFCVFPTWPVNKSCDFMFPKMYYFLTKNEGGPERKIRIPTKGRSEKLRFEPKVQNEQFDKSFKKSIDLS